MPPRATAAPDVRHLTTEQLGERLGGIKPETIRKWRQENRGPDYIKATDGANATVLYPLAWVEEWEASRRVAHAPA